MMKRLTTIEALQATCPECRHDAMVHQDAPHKCKQIVASQARYLGGPNAVAMTMAQCGCDYTRGDVVAHLAAERVSYPESLTGEEAVDAAHGIRRAVQSVIDAKAPGLYVEGFIEESGDHQRELVTVVVTDGLKEARFKFKTEHLKNRHYDYTTFVLPQKLQQSFRFPTNAEGK